jgi:hypothetical protein
MAAVRKLGWDISMVGRSELSNSRYFRLERKFDGVTETLTLRLSDHTAPRRSLPNDLEVHYSEPYSTSLYGRDGGFIRSTGSSKTGKSMSMSDVLSYLKKYKPAPRLPWVSWRDRRTQQKERNLVEGRKRMLDKARKVLANPQGYSEDKVRRSRELLARFT